MPSLRVLDSLGFLIPGLLWLDSSSPPVAPQTSVPCLGRRVHVTVPSPQKTYLALASLCLLRLCPILELLLAWTQINCMGEIYKPLATAGLFKCAVNCPSSGSETGLDRSNQTGTNVTSLSLRRFLKGTRGQVQVPSMHTAGSKVTRSSATAHWFLC